MDLKTQILSWAKAFADAQTRPGAEVEPHHVAAGLLMGIDPESLGQDPKLATWICNNSAAIAAYVLAHKLENIPKPSAPVTEPRPVSPALRVLLGRYGDSSKLGDLLEAIFAGLRTPAQDQQPHTQSENNTLYLEWSEDPELQALFPWIQGAVGHYSVESLTGPVLAAAALKALDAGALDAHSVLKAQAQGFTDELQAWLKHLKQDISASFVPVTDENQRSNVPLSSQLSGRLKKEDEKATLLWQLVQATITEASEYSRLLQVAYHEAGHAVVSLAIRPEYRITTLSIISKDGSAGRVGFQINPGYQQWTGLSREYVMEDLAVGMAGRIAEVQRFGALRADPGAHGDFAQATKLAWAAITAMGLDDEFGPIILAELNVKKDENLSQGPLYEQAQLRLQYWLKTAYADTQRLVEANWPAISALAEDLFSKREMSESDIHSAISNFRLINIAESLSSINP